MLDEELVCHYCALLLLGLATVTIVHSAAIVAVNKVGMFFNKVVFLFLGLFIMGGVLSVPIVTSVAACRFGVGVTWLLCYRVL